MCDSNCGCGCNSTVIPRGPQGPAGEQGPIGPSYVLPYKVYTALLSQESEKLFKDLVIGKTYTISDYQSPDDFSNVANVISGTINQNGCVFVATNTNPLDWNNGTVLTVNELSAPTAVILENTLGYVPQWEYLGIGNYGFSEVGGFPIDKTFVITPATIDTIIGVPQYKIVDTSGFPDFFGIYNPANVDDVYNYTPLEIRIYP
jgi:hypothetical protein